MIRSSEQTEARWRRAGLVGLGLATLVAYAGSFGAPFVFDDVSAVLANPSIHAWWNFRQVLAPPDGLSVSGRPIVNFSLALSHALSGEQPWGYHAINVAVHLMVGALLYGLLRQTLTRPVFAGRFARDADLIALAVAGVWWLHPLQTATVTYVMQRTEALMALCYVATLYLFARGMEAARPGGWRAGAVVVCALGMGCKEVMVSAPLLVWLYDRTFFTGGFGAAWREKKFFYAALASTWLVLGGLVISAKGRAGSAGWDAGMDVTAYALAQGTAILHYLSLVLWPAPLVFDYGTELPASLTAVVAVVGLAVASVVALWRKPAVGWLGIFFFAVLAPTSSFVPVATQTMAEHRMYLASAAAMVLLVISAYVGAGRRTLWLWLVVMIACAVTTWERNQDYRSSRTIWADTVVKRPFNARAHYNLGVALNAESDAAGAQREWREALRLEPAHAQAHAKLAEILAATGRASEALSHFEAAARGGQKDGIFLNNWGSALLATSQPAGALEKFEAAQVLVPDSAEVRFNRGNALVALARGAEATDFFREAVRLRPDYAEAHYNLGGALAQAGRYAEALTEFETTLRLAPADASAQRNIVSLRAYLGK